MYGRGIHCLALILTSIATTSAQPKKSPTTLENGVAIDLADVIPANERGILCLVDDTQGHIYGGTTGRAAHLFAYDTKKNIVRSLVRLSGGIGFAHKLVRLPDGSLIGGTQADPTGIAVKTDVKAVGWLYRFVIKDGKAKVEKLGRPVAGQGIYTLAFDKKTQTICGNTWPDGHFFTYDLKSRKFHDHGAIAGYRPFQTPRHAEDLNKGVKKKIRFPRVVSKAIAVLPNIGAITAGKDGYLFKYDFQKKKLTKTKFRLPVPPGREAWNSLDAVGGDLVPRIAKEPALAPYRNLHSYGAGVSDGHLIAFQVAFDKLHSVDALGRPFRTGNFHGLVGMVGVVGDGVSLPRFFALKNDWYTLHSHKLTLGGIPKADGQLSTVGFGAMIADKNGNIYAGEKDRIGRLVLYRATFTARPDRKKPKFDPNKLGGPAPDANLRKVKGRVIFAPTGTTTDGSGYTALAIGKDGHVYVGSARYGGYAWLLRFHPTKAIQFMEKVVHVLRLVGERLVGIFTQSKIHAIIIVAPDGKVWFATKRGHEIFGTRPEFDDATGYPGGHLCYYDPKTGFSRSVGILKRHQGLMGGVLDTKRNRLYYRTAPKHELISYDIKTGDVKTHGHIGHNCRYMVIDKDGAVYMPGRGPYLCRFDPKTGYIEDLKIKVEGPGHYDAPYVIEIGPNGKLYGAGIRHPWIMEFDIANYKKGRFPEVTMRNVAPAAPRGLPVYDIHAGVFGKDGRFYYPLVTNGPIEKGGKAARHLRLMRFDPKTATTATVGIPDVSVDESKVKHVYVRGDRYKLDHIQGVKVGADGTLYLLDIYPQLNVVMFPRLTAPRK